jgi:hypothetical protein
MTVGGLFLRFQAIYGNRALSMWGDVPTKELHAVWARHLVGFVAEDVLSALDATVTAFPDFPPTLPQFRSLCCAARDRRAQNVVKLPPPRSKQAMREVRALAEKFGRRT